MPSLYAMDATMKGIGREGKLALDVIRKEIPDWDARVEKARNEQLTKEAPVQPTLSEAMKGNNNAKKDRDGNSNSLTTAVYKQERGSIYLAARLKRDAPEIAKQLERGVINPFFSLI